MNVASLPAGPAWPQEPPSWLPSRSAAPGRADCRAAWHELRKCPCCLVTGGSELGLGLLCSSGSLAANDGGWRGHIKPKLTCCGAGPGSHSGQRLDVPGDVHTAHYTGLLVLQPVSVTCHLKYCLDGWVLNVRRMVVFPQDHWGHSLSHLTLSPPMMTALSTVPEDAVTALGEADTIQTDPVSSLA